MLFEQGDKLCKQGIKSFERHIKSSEHVKKTRMSLPGFRINVQLPVKHLIFSAFKVCIFMSIKYLGPGLQYHFKLRVYVKLRIYLNLSERRT